MIKWVSLMLTEILIHPQPGTGSNLSAASGANARRKWNKSSKIKKKKRGAESCKTKRQMKWPSPDGFSQTHRKPPRGGLPHSHLWTDLFATGSFQDSQSAVPVPSCSGGERWEKSSKPCLQQCSCLLQVQMEAFLQNMGNDQETM